MPPRKRPEATVSKFPDPLAVLLEVAEGPGTEAPPEPKAPEPAVRTYPVRAERGYLNGAIIVPYWRADEVREVSEPMLVQLIADAPNNWFDPATGAKYVERGGRVYLER